MHFIKDCKTWVYLPHSTIKCKNNEEEDFPQKRKWESKSSADALIKVQRPNFVIVVGAHSAQISSLVPKNVQFVALTL